MGQGVIRFCYFNGKFLLSILDFCHFSRANRKHFMAIIFGCLIVVFVLSRSLQLSETRLQIGIPNVVLSNDNYLNNYYRDYLIQNLHFSDNIEWNWAFRKKKMQHQLKFNNETERLMSIYILFVSGCRNFNAYFVFLVTGLLRSCFPYQRSINKESSSQLISTRSLYRRRR